MQFVANGPDIPDALLQAHEDGRVVFFCGAGISYPAGLPGFKGLVNEIYRLVGTSKTDIEKKAYEQNQYDATLNLLEKRIVGQRLFVRKALGNALKPKLRKKGAIDTHIALLQLARTRDKILRLVSTNFDRIFEHASKSIDEPFDSYAAPMLPIPKNSCWNGLVYLHGLLPEKLDLLPEKHAFAALDRLVLTSGDFGKAYLTERWAARFVSELFRNYVVCFTGYSIDDPILRYMMDALAADRMLGEETQQAFAFGECEPGQENLKTIEWEAKGVVPILYQLPSGEKDHSSLHNTLKEWAKNYNDGITGKERIVVNYAHANLSSCTPQDDFVGRMLWALSDESGIPAKVFAKLNPVPSLEWLNKLSEKRFEKSDLARFGAHSYTEGDQNFSFSLLSRPAPHSHAPWMYIVSGGAINSQWDNVLFHLANWLVRHLNDPALIVWVVQQGGHLHNDFLQLIENKLNEFVDLEHKGNKTKLEEIRKNSPNAIPEPMMKMLWCLLLSGRVKTPRLDLSLYRWKDRLIRDGLTTTVRLELRELLSPKISIKRSFYWNSSDDNPNKPKQLRQLVDWTLEIAADHVHSTLPSLEGKHWQKILPILHNDLQQLLHDALDLLRELGEANDKFDRSYRDLPSISPHEQNRRFRDWVALIELLRDSWQATLECDPKRATLLAQGWFDIPYPTFKRLALYAASKDDCISPEQWVDWLLKDDAWCLWSIDTQRETMRLLVLQGAKLSPVTGGRLENAILDGPPRAMYRDDIEPEYWKSLVDHAIWLYLAKLSKGGMKLSEVSLQRFMEISRDNPNRRLASDERDEFSVWMSGAGYPDYEENHGMDEVPSDRKELVNLLKKRFDEGIKFNENSWRNTCRTRFSHSLYALCSLSKEGVWPEEYWRVALQVWSEERNVKWSWRLAALIVQKMPDEVLQKVAHNVTWWLEAVSRSIVQNETILLVLCQRILTIPLQNDVENDQPLTRAINHPIGHVTQAILNIWFKRGLNDNVPLPKDIEQFFTQISDPNIEQFRHGRVLLASQLIVLFRVDRSWTEKRLLPLFDWENYPYEAKATWDGFLWSPRLYKPLLIAFKKQFLETTNHYIELGEQNRQFAALLTYAALEHVESFTAIEFQAAIEVLPPEGLYEVAQALLQALESAGEQREEYWKNRIKPFWRQIWPKSRNLITNNIAEPLARMCIVAGNEFPSALSTIKDWLLPFEYPFQIMSLLAESNLSNSFPEDVLTLLYAIIKTDSYLPDELGSCLKKIVQSAPKLKEDPRYKKLEQYLRQHST